MKSDHLAGGPWLDTAGLVKTFGDNRAVDGVDLRIERGTVYGLLGPNGAGKTTTVRMLATLLRPDGGEAHVFGHDVVREADAVRSRVSLTGQYASVDEDLTGTENLVLLARLTGHSKKASYDRAAQLLAAFGLSEAAGRQVKNYSGGMRDELVYCRDTGPNRLTVQAIDTSGNASGHSNEIVFIC